LSKEGLEGAELVVGEQAGGRGAFPFAGKENRQDRKVKACGNEEGGGVFLDGKSGFLDALDPQVQV
jgi:hypothetical protein